MKAELIDPKMVNSDLGAVNAARVSFAKQHSHFTMADEGLLKYLAEHNHWSPLAHPHLHLFLNISFNEIKCLALAETPGLRLGYTSKKKPGIYLISGSVYALVKNLRLFDTANREILLHALHDRYPQLSKALKLLPARTTVMPYTLVENFDEYPELWHLETKTVRLKAPIFVARQMVKHQVGFVWNEVSRRYVDDKPTFWRPRFWRARAKNVKQGSKSTAVPLGWLFDGLLSVYEKVSLGFYNLLLKLDVAPEQARVVLPLTLETEWWWTGRVEAFDRMLELRLDPHSQAETQELAHLIVEAFNANH